MQSRAALSRSLRLASLCLGLAIAGSEGAIAQGELALGPGDLRIEQSAAGGYFLYVRAKPGLGSILLTESTSDPERKSDSFAYRDVEKTSLNGEGRRIVEGKVITSANGLHFLVDSSPEIDEPFGQAFRIFIPWVVAWGYPWSRSGREFIHDGSFVNIRAFAKPYADYSAAYRDNPYIVRVSQGRIPAGLAAPASEVAPLPISAPAPAVPADRPASFDPKLYIPETIVAFGAITSAGGGELRYASSGDDIAAQIESLLEERKGKTLDLVICLDTTDTMAAALEALKRGLPAVIERRAGDFPSLRLGMIAYKDYFEEYLYKRFDFVSGVKAFEAELEGLESGGGRDIPEAVYEAVYAAATEFPWSAEKRMAVIVGDAPPHPLPRGSVDGPSAEEAARSTSVELDAVAVPK